MKLGAKTLILILISVVNTSFATEYKRFKSQKSDIISWNEDEGQQRLLSSIYKQDFFTLAHNYESQINPLYCGIASSVITLNSLKRENEQIPSQEDLEIILPQEFGGKTIEFRQYSQLTLLNSQTNHIKDKSVIELKTQNSEGKYDPGLTLEQLQRLLESYNLTVELYRADNYETKLKDFRRTLLHTLNQNNNIVLANFYGKKFGATTSGHISPIAAYHTQTDSILVLDVASHKNPWYWVNIELFFAAMSTKDEDNFRGYLLVSN